MTQPETETSIERLAGQKAPCHCWHVFDRNESRTETIRQIPAQDCADCGGSGESWRYPQLWTRCPCWRHGQGDTDTYFLIPLVCEQCNQTGTAHHGVNCTNCDGGWILDVTLEKDMLILRVRAVTKISFRTTVLECRIMCEVETYPSPKKAGFGATDLEAACDVAILVARA